MDVVGSTARADGADPEDVRDRNQLYYRETRERIERYGGVVEKYIGDAVMAVFGAGRRSSEQADRPLPPALDDNNPGRAGRRWHSAADGGAIVALEESAAGGGATS